MRKPSIILLASLIAAALLFSNSTAWAGYGKKFCHVDWAHCIIIKKGQSWQSLFPDPYERDLVKRLNRMNTRIWAGMTIAVPNDLSLSPEQISPFVSKIASDGLKTIIFSYDANAWGAYDQNGRLVRWGPASGGRGYCSDIDSRCRTPAGTYTIYEKQGPDCISTKFPVGEGGAPMPYCMFFNGGYALHGSFDVPGYHASHGCVRLFIEDARWLNEEFTPGGTTRVIVLPEGSENSPS